MPTSVYGNLRDFLANICWYFVSSYMLQKLFALADQTAAPDNVDALQHQEVLLPGHVLTMYAKASSLQSNGKLF